MSAFGSSMPSKLYWPWEEKWQRKNKFPYWQESLQKGYLDSQLEMEVNPWSCEQGSIQIQRSHNFGKWDKIMQRLLPRRNWILHNQFWTEAIFRVENLSVILQWNTLKVLKNETSISKTAQSSSHERRYFQLPILGQKEFVC